MPARTSIAGALALLILLPAVALLGSPLAAQESDDGQLPPLGPNAGANPEIGDDRISPELLGLATDSSQFGANRARYETAVNNHRLAEQAAAQADRTVVALEGTESRLDTQLQAARLRRDAAIREVDRYRSGLRDLAVEAFVEGGDDSAAETIDDSLTDEALDNKRDRVLVDAVTDNHRADYRTNVEIRDAAKEEVERITALLEATRERKTEAATQRYAAAVAREELAAEVEESRQAVADSRLTAYVVGLDFPLVALDAFWKASIKVNSENPVCGLRWEMLAGISRVEGVHGTWGGSSLKGDGTTTERITGPPLDGGPGVAAVPDTDGGYWDDDPVWDRGVGPMGFLPSSWRYYGSDGNGDDIADPHNIYDAAEASARLLCRSRQHLDQEEQLRGALFNYNRSERYVNIVVGYITNYDRVPLGLPEDPILQPPPVPASTTSTTTSSTTTTTTSTTPRPTPPATVAGG